MCRLADVPICRNGLLFPVSYGVGGSSSFLPPAKDGVRDEKNRSTVTTGPPTPGKTRAPSSTSATSPRPTFFGTATTSTSSAPGLTPRTAPTAPGADDVEVVAVPKNVGLGEVAL